MSRFPRMNFLIWLMPLLYYVHLLGERERVLQNLVRTAGIEPATLSPWGARFTGECLHRSATHAKLVERVGIEPTMSQRDGRFTVC
jgi:hypothetical protein